MRDEQAEGSAHNRAEAQTREAAADVSSPAGLSSAGLTTHLMQAISAAVVVHLLSSLALLAVIADATLGVYALLIAVVGLTGGVALGVARLFVRRGVSHVVRLTPAVFGLLPALASVGVGIPWLLTTDVLPNVEQALTFAVPLLAAATAPGLAIALNLEHVLAAIRARAEGTRESARGTGSGARSQPLDTEPPTLAGRLGRLVAGLAVGLCLLTLANILGEGIELSLIGARSYLAVLAVLAVVFTATLAAAGAGSSPGQDIQVLARRLEAIGLDSDESDGQLSRIVTQSALRPLDSVVRVTSFDAVGELFARLEGLRAELEKNVGSYQRALEKTHAVDAAKRDFLAAVSHELRTPLNSILGFAQLLLEDELTEAQAEDVRLILAGGHQLRDLIGDILDLSMIESGELELRFAPCELEHLVAELVDMHQAQVREGVELRADVRGSIPAVSCDRRRIGQVITNLLSNALKFTEAGEVVVGLRYDADAERVEVSVKDTGFGIAADELEAIFHEYQQVGETKRKIKGTGLGLAIARRIAEAHGGALSATSVIDEGATFRLALRLAPPSESGVLSMGGRR